MFIYFVSCPTTTSITILEVLQQTASGFEKVVVKLSFDD